jgi:archaetidylinositol phosphate synthase
VGTRLLAKLSERFGLVANRFARAALSLGLTPNAISLLGLSFAVSSGLAYGLGRDGGSQCLAGILLLMSGGFDALDGAMARIGGTASPFGSFFDSFLDRLGEVAVFLGILSSGRYNALAAASAMAFSLLVSYSRAKAESIGVGMKGVGLAERPERILTISIATFLGLLDVGLAVVAALAFLTALQRASRVHSSLKGASDRTSSRP